MKLLKERSIVALSFFVVLSLLAIVPSSYAEIPEDILEYCHNKSSTTAEYIKCITEELNKRRALEGKDVKDLKGYTQNRQANTISTQVVVSRNKDSLGYGPVFEGILGVNSCLYLIPTSTWYWHIEPESEYLILNTVGFRGRSKDANFNFHGYKDGDWITIISFVPVTGSFAITYNRFPLSHINRNKYTDIAYVYKVNMNNITPLINVYAYKDNQLFFSQENITGGLVQLPEIKEPAYLTIKIYFPIRDDSYLFNLNSRLGYGFYDIGHYLRGLGCSYSETEFITLSRLKSD